MRTGAIVSAILHTVVIVLTMMGWTFFAPDIAPSPYIDVDFVELGELTNVEATVKQSEIKPEPPQPTPKPETMAALPPEELEVPEIAPPPLEKLPEPPPEPPAEAKKPEPQVRKEVKPPEKKPPPKQVKKKKDEFDLDQLMKDLTAKAPQQQPEQTASDKTREQVGLGTARMATQRDALAGMLRSQVERCWSPPLGAPNAEQLVVSLNVSLSPAGVVQGIPEIVDTSRLGDTYYRAAAEAAQRAVVQCSPYQLPAEYYDVWKEIQFNMDPKQILG